MKQLGLVSSYSVKHYRPQKTKGNQSTVENKLNREFQQQTAKQAVVSDLTYVRVGNVCMDVCLYYS